MRKAVITADIKSSVRHTMRDLNQLANVIRKLVSDLEAEGVVSGLPIQRDGRIQLLVHDTRVALQTAMLIKSAANKTVPDITSRKRGQKVRFDLIVSLGLGEAAQDGPLADRDQPPFVLSGRGLEHLVAHRQTVGIFTGNEVLDRNFENLLFLYQWIMQQWSVTSAELIYYKLWGLTEREIAAELEISQPAVNQRSKAACWSGLDRILVAFREAENRYFD